ncbi:MAG: NAD(P)/FAD-dependent oxidoreductase [Candidatus Schekmanbacteria bacterium]|nr:NAD(P)/FAD-dependent oxidoreductase [Candidatus Schekmanbacteria bacterium]
MRGEYDAIVIGTGLGGAASAAVMASEGLRVLVLEKNTRMGGVCAAYEKRGFTIDIGTHMFSRGAAGPLGAIARRVGAAVPRFCQPADLAVCTGFGAHITVPRDLYRYPLFLLDAYRQLRVRPWELPGIYRFFRDVVAMPEYAIVKLDRVTMFDFLTRYTKNPHLIGLFGFLLGLYFILPLREVSAGEGVWCFQRMARDRALSYPLGGSQAVPATLMAAAAGHGARVELRAEVVRIHVDGGRARGVELADGRVFEAPVVVGTTSLKDHVNRLVGPAHFPESYVSRVTGIQGSMIAVQAKIALKKPLVRAGAVVGGHSDIFDLNNLKVEDFDRMYEDVVAGRVTRATPIYAPVPTNFDSTLGPRGCQLITACAVAPTLDIPLVDSPARWIDNMMLTLERIIPGLHVSSLFIDTMDVRFIQRWMGKTGGSAVSTGQVVGQVGNRRPPVRTPIVGLYVCGDGAGARGVGTELAARSGELAADTVICDYVNGLLGVAPRI